MRILRWIGLLGMSASVPSWSAEGLHPTPRPAPALASGSEEKSGPERLNGLKGYKDLGWGDSFEEVNKKYGPLTPYNEKFQNSPGERTYYRDGEDMAGRPARTFYSFYEGRLSAVDLFLNDTTLSLDMFPAFFTEMREWMVDQFGQPEREQKDIRPASDLDYKKQVELGYFRWVAAWRGERTTVVLQMRPEEGIEAMSLTMLPTKPFWLPSPAADPPAAGIPPPPSGRP